MTVPKELVEEMRERAKGNVSRYVSDAIENKLQRDRYVEYLEELSEGKEPFSEENLARARAEWPDG